MGMQITAWLRMILCQSLSWYSLVDYVDKPFVKHLSNAFGNIV